MRVPGLVRVAGSPSISLLRHQRNAVRVLPVPVGARMRVDSPRAMAGQPSRCGAVGLSKTARNQAAVMGWKRARVSVAVGSGGGAVAAAFFARGVLAGFELGGFRGIGELTSRIVRGNFDWMLPGCYPTGARNLLTRGTAASLKAYASGFDGS